jgi:hypothetical protein
MSKLDDYNTGESYLNDMVGKLFSCKREIPFWYYKDSNKNTSYVYMKPQNAMMISCEKRNINLSISYHVNWLIGKEIYFQEYPSDLTFFKSTWCELE